MKVALVTGASSGIGRAAADLLAREGWRVYAASRTPAGVSGEHAVRPLAMDVTRDASVREAVTAIVTGEGRLDLVVNSAGYGLAGAVEDTSDEEAYAQFDTNFFGVLRVVRAALPHLRAQGNGMIINIGSLAGLMGLPFQAVYSASKFAVEGLTEGLRQEVARYGVRVVVVEPGDARTNITANRILTRAGRNGSAYAARFGAALQVIEREERAGVAAEDVARVIARLAGSSNPPVRVRVGRLTQTSAALVKRFAGSRAFERLLMAHYGQR
jgi:NAD(P)-dependent dehydrogenase (short-subunit alcohol dehydrogenase family)